MRCVDADFRQCVSNQINHYQINAGKGIRVQRILYHTNTKCRVKFQSKLPEEFQIKVAKSKKRLRHEIPQTYAVRQIRRS